jgi:uncharacterized protein (TIGR01777 family)
MNKIVIAGGSGFVGTALANHLSQTHHVVLLSRHASEPVGNIRTIKWDAQQLGSWVDELDGAQALINLTGKNVNCRYTPGNKAEILESRTVSTRILGNAMKICQNPPPVWIQMSSATIYRHAEDKPMDETFGEIGDDFSMNVCKAWEQEFNNVDLPAIRKVILRTSIVIGNGGGAMGPLINLVKFGLGGSQGSGQQMVSWIHITDLISIIDWMLHNGAVDVYNVTSPQPIRNQAFMKIIRKTWGISIALPAPAWLLKLGAIVIGTETELVLKSRWVIPKRLIQEGYRFRYPTLESAVKEILLDMEAEHLAELKIA